MTRPDLVLLLNISEETRAERVNRRSSLGPGTPEPAVEKTREEGRLESDREFRENVLEAYRRIEGGFLEILVDHKSIEELADFVFQELLLKNAKNLF